VFIAGSYSSVVCVCCVCVCVCVKQMLQNLHELLLRQHYSINNVILQSIAPTVSLGTVKIANTQDSQFKVL